MPWEVCAMPSTRYTVRLPPALDTAVQEYLRTAGTSSAVLIRQALAAYLAETLPTAPPTGSRHPLTGTLTPADSVDRLQTLEAQMAEMTTRVKVIEASLTQWPPGADMHADRSADSRADQEPTAADRRADSTPTGVDTSTRRQRKLTPRQQRALRDKHQRGVPMPALMEEYGLSRASVFRYLQSDKRYG
jgi:hypothetical protein